MSSQIFLSTTGTLSTVIIDDLGGVEYTHPVSNLELIMPEGEFTYEEIINSIETPGASVSASLQASLNAGHITLTDAAGDPISDLTSTTLPHATETLAGIVELATQVEVDTATDDERVVTPLKAITGVKRFTDNQVINDQGLTSTASPPYTLSIQDTNNTYIELLTTNTEGGADRGVFFGLENNGPSAGQQDFALYNWQGGPIKFYTGVVPSSGTNRLEISPNGVLSVGGTPNYESLIGADDDIPNIKWIQDNINGNTDLSLGTISITDVPILSSTGNDISTLPPTTSTLAGIITATTQTIGGRKTFSDDLVIIDSPNSSDNLEIGWFDGATVDCYGIRQSGVSGLFCLMPNADNPQIILGNENNTTGSAFIDVDNNRPLNLNVLDTGAGSPAVVNIGTGGLNINTGGNITLGASNTVDGVDVSSPKNSIQVDTNQYQLVGDLASPGANQVYGTDGAGVKGWKADPTSGESNTASNLGAGIGTFDGKVGVDLQFRSLISQNNRLTIALDAVNDEVDFTVNEANINHNALTNYVANEHINHTSVNLTAGTGLTGGGDISASRTFNVVGVNSIVANADDIQLVNDAASPGNNQYYGTNATGTKGFHSIATGDLASLRLSRSTSLNPIPLTWTAFDWTTKHLENNTAIISYPGTPASQININETGLYLVSWAISVDDEVDVRILNNGSEVAGSFHSVGEKADANDVIANNAKTIAVNLTSGTLTLQVIAITTDEFTIANSASLSITRLKGIKGDTGATGSGSNITVKDEGINLANTPHSSLNFIGSAVTASDAGGGQANITVSGGLVKTLINRLTVDFSTSNTMPNWVTMQTFNFTPTSASNLFLIHYTVQGDSTNDSRGAMVRILYGLTGSESLIGNAAWYCRKKDNVEIIGGAFVGRQAALGAGQHTILIQVVSGQGDLVRCRPVSFPTSNHSHLVIQEVTA